MERACRALTRDSQTEDCQHVGLILRDAWIEYSRIVREGIERDAEKLGRNDVKGVVDALNLPQAVAEKAKRAYSATNSLQHDLRAAPEDAVACFSKTTEAMAEIVSVRFPGLRDPRMEDMIRPN